MPVKSWMLAASLVLASSIATGRGPDGVGQVKLGMTQSELSALPTSGVHFPAPFIPEPSGDMGDDGEFFRTTIKTPWEERPLPARVHFVGGELASLNIDLEKDDGLANRIVAQITERHGAPTTEDARTEESCPTLGGASETVRGGSVTHRWSSSEGQWGIRSTVRITDLQSCLAREFNIPTVASVSLNLWREEVASNPF